MGKLELAQQEPAVGSVTIPGNLFCAVTTLIVHESGGLAVMATTDGASCCCKHGAGDLALLPLLCCSLSVAPSGFPSSCQ